jgi:SAM-dependent methyltransferase
MGDTTDQEYTDRLLAKSNIWWKRLLDVQRPYRWNLRRLGPGFMLDIGCGIGRNLLAADGVGVDHNPASVDCCRRRGLKAFLPEDFFRSEFARPGTFDSILLAHVAEHMKRGEVVELVTGYLPFLKTPGKLILITPQERGYGSDETHVEFVDFEASNEIHRRLGFEPVRSGSFPFPRFAGKLFIYNEFVVVGRRTSA